MRITDILLEVDDATGFTEAFTHLRTGKSCRQRLADELEEELRSRRRRR